MKRLAVLLALTFLLGVGDACAHASLVGANPEDGAVLGAAPAEAVLRFDEPVSIVVIRLLDDTGAAVALPVAPRSEGPNVRVELPTRMREGTYLLSYRVTSRDSHPVGGAIAFSLGRASGDVRVEADSATSWTAWAIAVRAVRDLALLIAAGGALFVVLVTPFPGERLVLGVAGGMAVALCIAGIGLQGVALLGNAGPFEPEPWSVALRTSYSKSAMAAAAASLTIAVAAALPRLPLRGIALAAGAGAVAASLTLTGHAASAGFPALARLAVGVHALAAAFWSGSLVALCLLLTRTAGRTAPALRRFSRIAVWAVAVLIAAGAAFAALQLASLVELVDTPYGNLLLAKVALAVLLICLAARNRLVLLPSLEHGDPGTTRRLQRAIAAEIAIVGLIIALTAGLVHTPPRPERVIKSLVGATHTVALAVTPGRGGRNLVLAVIRDREGRAFDPAEAQLEIANVAAGIEPMTRALVRTGAGEYRYQGSDLAFRGRWNIGIRMRIDDFEQVRLDGVVDIR